MPFPGRSAPAPAPAHVPAPAPAGVSPPAHPAAPGPGAPTAPMAPTAERMFYAYVNGAAQLMSETQVRSLPATTQVMTQDQASGWVPASTLLGAVATAPAGGMGRAAFAAPQRPGVGAATGAGAPAGMFAGVANADVMRRGNYFTQGDYVARLCSAEYKNGRTGSFVIFELEIIESTYDPDPTKAETHEANRVGSRATQFIKQNDNFASNIKEIVIALSGFDPQGKPRDVNDLVSSQECEQLISAAQPFTGAYVYLEARDTSTRAGGEFTRVNWWPMPMKPDSADAAKQVPDFDRLFADIR